MNLVCKVGGMIRQRGVRLLADESGQDLIEYALLAALIALGAITAIKSLGTKVSGAFTNVGTTLTTNT
jgi:pilus assembly protein Flp/PilA